MCVCDAKNHNMHVEFEDNFQESISSFYHVDTKYPIKECRSYSESLYPQSHPGGP